MNKVETQARILRYLAVIQYQVELLGRHGQNISNYTETAVADAMKAITGLAWTNLNATSNNFPGIDLISPDGTYGVQATAHLKKDKFDKTVDAVTNELIQIGNRISALKRVEVVGLTCVANTKVTSWKTISTPEQTIMIRGISLEKRLELQNQNEAALADLDRAFQGLASTNSPYHLRSDKQELQTAIIPYLVRPAIRDRRLVEQDWYAMQEAMLSIRRLLTQGINDAGMQITRPYATFQPAAAGWLRQIYDDTSAISTLLKDEQRNPGSLRDSDWSLLDGHRLRIQEHVTDLAIAAGLTPPVW
jgi:hypothetical protein